MKDGKPLPTPVDLALIGSKAMAEWLPLANRDPIDCDFIGTFDAVQAYIKRLRPLSAFPISGKKWIARDPSQTIYEFEIAWSGSTAEEFLHLVAAELPKRLDDGSYLPSLDLLYTLKMSHRFLKNSPHFMKTLTDCKRMRQHEATIRDEFRPWFERREKETYNYSHPNLNQSKVDFFKGDGITYVYDHDSIHEAVKIGERPAYTYFRVPGKEVMTSKELFDKLPYHVCINAVLEESFVLAIERSLIPFPLTDPDRAFKIALMKVCTSITSGWFREYSWENYHAVVEAYKRSPNYVEMFNLGLSTGIIMTYKS